MATILNLNDRRESPYWTATSAVVRSQKPLVVGLAKYFRLGPRLVVAASTLLLGLRFFYFVSRNAVDILFRDQWDYLGAFFRHSPGLVELFLWQHGPHREGVGLILDKFVYPLTRWNSRVDSFVIAGCIFAAMLLAFRLKQELFGSVSYFDLAIPLIFLKLSQGEGLVETPNPAYGGFPLLMIIMYCLALLARDRLLRYGLILLLNVLLIYTGFGLFMGLVTLGVFVLECSWSLRGLSDVPARTAITGLVIAGASLGSFFVHYKFIPAVACFVFPYHPLIAYLWFVAIMFGNFLAPSHGLLIPTVAGAGVLLGVVVILVVSGLRLLTPGRFTREPLVEVVLLGYSLMFAVNTALGRVCMGLSLAPQAGRYVTLLIPAFLAIYFYLLSSPWAWLRKAAPPLFVLALLPTALVTFSSLVRQANGKRAWADCYRSTEEIDQCDQATHFEIYPDPPVTGLKQKLDYLKQHRLNLFSGPAK